MSSFQLNLSALTLGACERLARLDAAGGAVKALLSPSPSGSGPSAMASSAPVAASSAGVASLPLARSLPSDSRVSIEQLVAGGGGRSPFCVCCHSRFIGQDVFRCRGGQREVLYFG